MPKYDFKCDACKKTIERTFKGRGHNEFKCKCGGRMIKQISPPNIAFKGPGFYSTSK